MISHKPYEKENKSYCILHLIARGLGCSQFLYEPI